MTFEQTICCLVTALYSKAEPYNSILIIGLNDNDYALDIAQSMCDELSGRDFEPSILEVISQDDVEDNPGHQSNLVCIEPSKILSMVDEDHTDLTGMHILLNTCKFGKMGFLGSDDFKSFFQNVRNNCKPLICVTPPITKGVEAIRLVPLADLVLVVVEQDKTSLNSLRQVLRIISPIEGGDIRICYLQKHV